MSAASKHQGKRQGGPMGGGPMGGMMVPGQKAKDAKGTVGKLLKYFKPYTFAMVMVLVTAVLGAIFSIVGPKILGKATDSLADSFMKFMMKGGKVPTEAAPIGIDFPYIGKIVLIMIGLYFVSALFMFIQSYVIAGVSQKVTYKLRKNISEKIGVLPLKYYDTQTHGEILSRITNDVETVSTTLQQGVSQMITSIVTIIGIIIMMLTISPLLTLIAILTLPVSILLISVVVKMSQKHYKNQQEKLGVINGHVEEMYSGHNIVKVFNMERRSIETFEKTNKELYGAAWKSNFLSGLMMPMMGFVSNLGYVAICIVGGALAVDGKLGIGGIQAFLSYIRQMSQPIAQTANIANVMQSTIAAAERVFEFLEESEEIPETTKPVVLGEVKGDVTLEHVSFGYHEDTMILKDVSLHAQSGQMIAIVGPTGAGKTTIINLLMRFYDVNQGCIKIDGVDIRDMKRADLRSIFGMVLQDTWLFGGTIRENIAYSKDGATDAEIQAAAKSAHVTHFVNTLAEGYDMVINEEASNISQGQRQLLTIARAILADPPILILDEATSSVDTRTEIRIQRAMNNLMRGRTSFVIAHRLSTIRDADLILVMNEGNIIEQGKHEELLERGGFYANLYNSQFEKAV